MDASERYILIQRYLDGTLTPEEHRAVEARMAVDVEFRVEVELQRRARQTVTPPVEPRRVEIEQMLPDGVPPPRMTPYNYDYTRLILGFAGALLVFWIILELAPSIAIYVPRPSSYLPRREEPVAATPPEVVYVPVPPVVGEAVDTAYEGIVAEPMTPSTTPPAPFAPNDAFEALRGYRGPATDTIYIDSPEPAEHFALVGGRVEIPFRGAVSATRDTVVFPVTVQLFSNASSPDAPQLSFSPEIITRADTLWTFASTRRLRMPPGLYYYTVRRTAGVQAAYTGKFTVGQ